MDSFGYVSTGDAPRPSGSLSGVLLDVRGKTKYCFLVLDATGFWAVRLSAYCKVVRVRRKNVKYVLRFSFRSLFSALLRFPNFAERLLQIEYRGYDEVAKILLRHAWLAKYTLPVSVESISSPFAPAVNRQAPQGAISTLFDEVEANADVL